MLTVEQFLFFLFAFATFSAIVWSSLELFTRREDPLKDRLEELQASAESTAARGRRRRSGGGFLNQVLYVLSMIPGLDDYLSDTEKELAQAGILRRARALVFGEMPSCDEPGGEHPIREVLLDAFREFAGPVLFGFPSGHTTGPTWTLPLGVKATVVTSSPAVIIEEAAVS